MYLVRLLSLPCYLVKIHFVCVSSSNRNSVEVLMSRHFQCAASVRFIGQNIVDANKMFFFFIRKEKSILTLFVAAT